MKTKLLLYIIVIGVLVFNSLFTLSIFSAYSTNPTYSFEYVSKSFFPSPVYIGYSQHYHLYNQSILTIGRQVVPPYSLNQVVQFDFSSNFTIQNISTYNLNFLPHVQMSITTNGSSWFVLEENYNRYPTHQYLTILNTNFSILNSTMLPCSIPLPTDGSKICLQNDIAVSNNNLWAIEEIRSNNPPNFSILQSELVASDVQELVVKQQVPLPPHMSYRDIHFSDKDHIWVYFDNLDGSDNRGYYTYSLQTSTLIKTMSFNAYAISNSVFPYLYSNPVLKESLGIVILEGIPEITQGFYGYTIYKLIRNFPVVDVFINGSIYILLGLVALTPYFKRISFIIDKKLKTKIS